LIRGKTLGHCSARKLASSRKKRGPCRSWSYSGRVELSSRRIPPQNRSAPRRAEIRGSLVWRVGGLPPKARRKRCFSFNLRGAAKHGAKLIPPSIWRKAGSPKGRFENLSDGQASRFFDCVHRDRTKRQANCRRQECADGGLLPEPMKPARPQQRNTGLARVKEVLVVPRGSRRGTVRVRRFNLNAEIRCNTETCRRIVRLWPNPVRPLAGRGTLVNFDARWIQCHANRGFKIYYAARLGYRRCPTAGFCALPGQRKSFPEKRTLDEGPCHFFHGI